MLRLELRGEETHLVVDADALFPGDHPELSLSAVRSKLADGEQAVSERGAQNAIRLVLPQHLQLRGGRTVITGGPAEVVKRRINPGLVSALKRAHADLLALNASPFSTPEDLTAALAPAIATASAFVHLTRRWT